MILFREYSRLNTGVSMTATLNGHKIIAVCFYLHTIDSCLLRSCLSHALFHFEVNSTARITGYDGHVDLDAVHSLAQHNF